MGESRGSCSRGGADRPATKGLARPPTASAWADHCNVDRYETPGSVALLASTRRSGLRPSRRQYIVLALGRWGRRALRLRLWRGRAAERERADLEVRRNQGPRRHPRSSTARGTSFQDSGSTRSATPMLEATGIPPDWSPQANALDEVWVPIVTQPGTISVQRRHPPIHRHGAGVDVDYFHPFIERRGPGAVRVSRRLRWGDRKAPERC